MRYDTLFSEEVACLQFHIELVLTRACGAVFFCSGTFWKRFLFETTSASFRLIDS